MHTKFIYVTLLFIIWGDILSNEIHDKMSPAFFESMSSWDAYDHNKKFDKNKALYDLYAFNAKELYEAFWVNDVQISPVPRIPKIIHQIWLGSPFPEKYKNFQQSWKKYHPDWTYILWTEKEIEEFGLTNDRLFHVAKNYGQKSDIARYEILYRIGGLYIDTDFECIKSFDILHHCLDFYTSCLPEKNGSLSLLNGLIASSPGHPILKTCIERLMTKDASKGLGDILEATGPYFFTKCVYDNLSPAKTRSVIFPSSFFYPLPDIMRFKNISKDMAMQQFVHDESFAIHWWHCSWQK